MKKTIALLCLSGLFAACAPAQPRAADAGSLLTFDAIAAEISVTHEIVSPEPETLTAALGTDAADDIR